MDSLQQNSAFLAAVMLLAGIGIPIMAALNAGLSGRLQSPAVAATILLAVGLLAAVIYLFVFEGFPKTLSAPGTPLYYYFAGLFMVFYLLSITWVAPRFGVGNAVAFVLLGQLISMTAIDHFGMMGAPQSTLTLQRAAGLCLMAAGVFLVVRK